MAKPILSLLLLFSLFHLSLGAVNQTFSVPLPVFISPNTPGLGAGIIEEAGSIDVYTFSVQESSFIYELVSYSLPLSNLRVRLSKIEGGQKEVLHDDCLACSQWLSFQEGDYELTIGDTTQLGTGDYSIQILPAGVTEFYNISLDGGVALVAKDHPPGAGHLATTGEAEKFTFEVTQPVNIYWALLSYSNPTMVGVRISLRDENQYEVFHSSFATPKTGPFTLSVSGKYELSFVSHHGIVGDYSFAIWKVPDPVTYSIGFGQTVTQNQPEAGAGVLEVPSEKDKYTIFLNQEEKIFFQDLGHVTSLSQVGVVVENEHGIILTFSELSRNFITQAGVGGQHIITVGGSNTLGVGEYSFILHRVGASQLFLLNELTVGEFNPGELGAGAGIIEGYGSEDQYEFTLETPQELTFELRVTSVEGDMGELSWKIEDDLRQSVASGSVATPFSGLVLREGDYVLKIGGDALLVTGSYILIVQTGEPTPTSVVVPTQAPAAGPTTTSVPIPLAPTGPVAPVAPIIPSLPSVPGGNAVRNGEWSFMFACVVVLVVLGWM